MAHLFSLLNSILPISDYPPNLSDQTSIYLCATNDNAVQEIWPVADEADCHTVSGEERADDHVLNPVVMVFVGGVIHPTQMNTVSS